MLGVVVPCYNEEEVIEELVKEFERLREDLLFDLIFVDDGSTDETGAKIDGLSERYRWIRVVRHEKNQGIAQSLKDGFSYALGAGYLFIAQMDADLTHPPALLIPMMELAQKADLVVASRYVEGGGMKNVSSWRIAISRVGNRLFRLALGIKTRDSTSGYRLGRSEVYKSLRLETDSFGIQLEITVKAERQGYMINEIPFVLANRKKGRSKFKLRYILGYVPLVFRLIVAGRI